MPPSATDQQQHYGSTLIEDLAKILDLQEIFTRKERRLANELSAAMEQDRIDENTPGTRAYEVRLKHEWKYMLGRHPWEILQSCRYRLFTAIHSDHPNRMYWECRQAYTDAYFILADAQKRLEH